MPQNKKNQLVGITVYNVKIGQLFNKNNVVLDWLYYLKFFYFNVMN